jgi:hypothetical protein
LMDLEPDGLAELVAKKVGVRQRDAFLPPRPDRLYEALDAETQDEKDIVSYHAQRFFAALRRMSQREREVVATIFIHGCSVEMPENLHMSLDLLRRYVGMPASEVKATLAQTNCLGFRCLVRDWEPDDTHELKPDDEMLELSWSPMTDFDEGEPMDIAFAMVRIAIGSYCEEHGVEALRRLDFSRLALATTEEHVHEQS